MKFASWRRPIVVKCTLARVALAFAFTSFLVIAFSRCQSQSSNQIIDTSSQASRVVEWHQPEVTSQHLKLETTGNKNYFNKRDDKRKLSTRSLRNNGQQVATKSSLVAAPLAGGGGGGTNISSSCLPNDLPVVPPTSGITNLAAAPSSQGQEDLLSSGSSSSAALAFQQQKSSFGFTQTRASEFVKPNFYTLRLKLDPEKRKFGGQLMVSVDLLLLPPPPVTSSPKESQPVDSTGTNQTGVRYLSLHAGANLSIKKAFYVFTSRSSIQIPATRIGRNLTSELLTLDFHPNSIPLPSQGLLLLVYSGQVNDTESHGLFLHKSAASSRPTTTTGGGGGGDPYVSGLATHMEPSFARRLFPAWDEPHLKARFSLIVVLPFRGYETISNMPVKRKSISLSCSGEPLQEVEFHTTPTMSTYLLVLVVGKFEHIESITPNNCKVRAYFYANHTAAAAVDQQQQQKANAENQTAAAHHSALPSQSVNMRRRAAQMALDVAVRTFDYLEGALGVKYPLPKFDMIALRDFNSGGMENWGASLFHENYLLCDNHNQNVNIRVNGGSNRPKRLVVPLVVAHEIVHQWFGNLLTARTWTHLWLNEGFAQLLMYEVAQALLPAEPYWHIFIEDNRRSAMAEDELITSSRALELGDIDLLDQESQLSLFDQLTYNKGAMVVRMVQFAMGPREFLAGLRHYLLKHAYDSVSSHDLWAALEESATGRGLQERQLETSMAAWLKLEGFPVLRVRISESPDGQHYKLEYEQERFTLLPAEAASWQQQQQQAPNSTATPQTQDSAWASWLWSIPVTLASELGPEPSEAELRLWPAQNATSSAFLVSDKAGSILLPRATLGNWFKLNHQASGYYRVDYELPAHTSGPERPVDMLARMAPAVRDHSMAPIDRYNLIEDLFAMVLAGRKPLVAYLRFLDEAYGQEHELLVLRFIFDSLERVRAALVSNSSPAAARNKLERSFDQYVQRFVRKLIGAFKARVPPRALFESSAAAAMASSGEPQQQQDAPMSHRALFSSQTSGNKRRRRRRSDDVALTVVGANTRNSSRQDEPLAGKIHTQRGRRAAAATSHVPADSSSDELLELFDSTRLVNNNEQLARWSSDLFARNFRLSNTQTQPQLLDSLGRDLRASIYSAALNYQPNAPATNDAPEPDYVTSLVRNLEDIWARIRQQSGGGGGGSQTSGNKTQTIFTKLLTAYEFGEASSSERAAIAQALGSTREPSKQMFLLNVTLASQPGPVFRAQDAGLLLDSLARSRDGRRLIWTALNEQPKLFKQRQLLAPALKSVSRGLIEELAGAEQASASNTTTVEGQLRQLYVIYGASELGKLIGQSIEWVRINSLWFKRDHSALAEFLAASGNGGSGGSTADD